MHHVKPYSINPYHLSYHVYYISLFQTIGKCIVITRRKKVFPSFAILPCYIVTYSSIMCCNNLVEKTTAACIGITMKVQP